MIFVNNQQLDNDKKSLTIFVNDQQLDSNKKTIDDFR
jgi:hypothetical protein